MRLEYSTTIELPFVSIIFKKEGYIHLHYKNQTISLTESRKLFEVVRKNSPWEKCPFLISGDDFSNNDKESKKFNTSEQVTKHMSAQAFLINSAFQRITVNFFVKVFAPKVPLKIFTNTTEAESWLSSFVNDNISAKSATETQKA